MVRESHAISPGRPLRGFRVVTLAVNVPGPVAAADLSQLGAEVFKIEPPNGDPLATTHCPAWYKELLGTQKVVRLNLKEPNDRSRLDQLLKNSHLLLTSSRPDALERLALGWKDLHAKFPKLCQVALVGYPGRGRNTAGHDLTYEAQAGLLDPPALPVSLWADLVSAQRAVIAVLSLLLEGRRSKRGGYAEVSIEESLKIFAAPLVYGLTSKGGVLGGGLPEYNLYRSSDGWLAVAALEPHFAKKLKEELGVSKLDYRRIASVFGKRTASYWEKWALDRDLPVLAVPRRRSGRKR